MALITCFECSNQISSTAPTCPHCGAVQVIERISTDVIESLCDVVVDAPDNGANGVSAFVAVIGVVFLFIAFPIGIVALVISGFISLFKNTGKKLVVKEMKFVGNCPYCTEQLHVVKHVAKTMCPTCKKPFEISNMKFYQV